MTFVKGNEPLFNGYVGEMLASAQVPLNQCLADDVRMDSLA